MHLPIRVAVCGAGPSGLSQLHAFESARQSGTKIPETVCFEKQNDLGGQWKYTWQTTIDDYSEPVHSSMYQNLWTNAPKECIELVDYSFDEYCGKPCPSFVPHTVILDYIRKYAERNNVHQYIQFNTVVRWISYCSDKKKFNILVKDLKQEEIRAEEFDYVIIATGHFSTPNIPHFDGIETFPGRMLHSHEFRSSKQFIDKRILIIGNGLSGDDIVVQLYKYGVKSITISYRTRPSNLKWPDEIKEVPSVVKIDGPAVYFKDGLSQVFDVIILCTGYLYNFPFVEDDYSLRLTVKSINSFYPSNLYKSIFWSNQPRLIYLSMQTLTFDFNYGNAQAWYARDVILGRIPLPSTIEEMKADMDLWQEKAKQLRNLSDVADFFKDYILSLVDATDYPHFNMNAMNNIFLDSRNSKSENPLTYRDKVYISAITNTMAKQHHIPWLQEMDDTLENFI